MTTTKPIGIAGGEEVFFPVIFSDGKQEIDIGVILIWPSLDFNHFQSYLCYKTGLFPDQFFVYLTYGKNPQSPLESHCKIHITRHADFSAIVKQKDCFFLVVLKRSDQESRPRNRYHFLEIEARLSNHPPDFMVFEHFGDRCRKFEMNRAKFMADLERIDKRLRRCESCSAARRMGREVEFHHCVRDPVVIGFRTTFDPIARPRH